MQKLFCTSNFGDYIFPPCLTAIKLQEDDEGDAGKG